MFKIEDDGYRDKMYAGDNNLRLLIDTIIAFTNKKKKIKLLKTAVEIYPHYYDFYINIATETNTTLPIESGCKYAIQRLKDENKGKLPKKVNWYFIENRHIFRVIYGYAEILSNFKMYRETNRLLNILLKFHPNDNIGARFLKEKNKSFLQKNEICTDI